MLDDGVPAAGEAELVRHVARTLRSKGNDQVDCEEFRDADPQILVGSSLLKLQVSTMCIIYLLSVMGLTYI